MSAVLNILTDLKSMGISQISEYTLKDFFSQNDSIRTTGKEIKECATKLGIKLKDCKTVIPNDFMTNKKFTKEILVELYVNQKMNQSQISRMYHCSKATIHDNLKKHGIEIRQRIKNLPSVAIDKDIEKIKTLHMNGATLNEIAKMYNSSRVTVHRKLDECGYSCKEVRKRNGRIKRKNSDIGK